MKFVWVTYIQPKIDYCSQLWGPTSGKNLTKIENLLKTFTQKVEGIRHLTYWERLKFLDISSIERRIECYRCIYTWKIVSGNALNYNLKWSHSDTKGTLCETIKVGSYYKTARSHSFQYSGPRLFNSLPRYVRDFRGNSSEFKVIINELLRKIPDQPMIDGLYPEPCHPHSASPTNNVSQWIQYLGLSNRRKHGH